MTTKTKPPTNAEIAARLKQAPKPSALTAEQADLEIAEAYAEAYAEGFAEGVRIETARCEAIIMSPEAEGRDKVALHFACNTDMSAEAAIQALKMTPKATPAPQADGGYDTGFLAAFGYGRQP